MDYSSTKDIITYWDDAIRLWLAGEWDALQKPFLGNLGLSEEDMPEPYWGDPHNCSFVIVNYNPGGGFNRDRHTYRDCAGCPKSIITYAQQMGYSTLARPFPLLMSEGDLKANGMEWVKQYSGWTWWQKKLPWIEQIKEAAAGQGKTKSEKLPFVFELCALHSKNFNEKCMDVVVDNNELKALFCRTLREAVSSSDLKLAVCVGAKFNGFLDKLEFKRNPSLDGEKGPRCFQTYNCVNDHPEQGRIIVTWVPKSRNRYQLFSKEDLDVLKSLI